MNHQSDIQAGQGAQTLCRVSPGFCGLVAHVLLLSQWSRLTGWLRLGYLFLLLNVPFGYGGAAVCGLVAAQSSCPRFWGAMSLLVYAASWGMLLAGAAICGQSLASRFAWRSIRRSWRAWRRLRRIREQEKGSEA